MPEEIKTRLIEEEMKENYIDYAMSVITARALPDVRDGLKPVHRRVLYAMSELGLLHNKPHKKCARIVGEVLGKFHPHGDTAVYDTLVRLAQNFSLKYPLVDGQGNFGSIDGDNAAAMRYTEARLSKIAEEILVDIDKDTVTFVPNFDGSLQEPKVLPSKLPNLLINGSSGIAVGMATNIPPHNINEVVDAITAVINNQEINTDELLNYIKGPDFPTAGFILGRNGIKEAYKTGRGKIKLRAKANIDDSRIIISEIPYMVNKSVLIEDIANLVKDKKIEGIRDIRDESDRKGMRVVIELRKDANAEIVLNQLYKHTNLQTTFGIIMIGLVAGQPRLLNLKDLISHFIKHRKNIVTRRTKFELNKASERAHILEGLKIALLSIDDVVQDIKKSENVNSARILLQEKYKLSEKQSQAILDMKLQRLTSLEQDKIKNEHDDLIKLIVELRIILSDENKILEIIKKELQELKEKYGDVRKTNILDVEEVIEMEDLVDEEDVVITVTHDGYVKQIPLTAYKQQRRGGFGIVATETKEEDTVKDLFITNNHNYLLFFTNKGKVHWLKAYTVPLVTRYSRGKALVNLLKLEQGERVNTVLPVSKFSEELFLIFATKKGLVKKTSLNYFSKPRHGGIAAIKLRSDDELVRALLSPGKYDLVLGTGNGRAVRFDESNIIPTGRNTMGVRGVRLRNDHVIGMEIVKNDSSLLTITENGFGKRTKIDDYRQIRRGGSGVINIKTNERNGKVVGIKTVMDYDEVMFITQKGNVIRTNVKDISCIGRNTAGVILMKLKEDDKVSSVAKVISS